MSQLINNKHQQSRLSHAVPRKNYGVALVSRIDKIIGLFYKRALLKRWYSAKETYNFIDPTDRSHPISHTVPRKKANCQETPSDFVPRSDDQKHQKENHRMGQTWDVEDDQTGKETETIRQEISHHCDAVCSFHLTSFRGYHRGYQYRRRQLSCAWWYWGGRGVFGISVELCRQRNELLHTHWDVLVFVSSLGPKLPSQYFYSQDRMSLPSKYGFVKTPRTPDFKSRTDKQTTKLHGMHSRKRCFPPGIWLPC